MKRVRDLAGACAAALVVAACAGSDRAARGVEYRPAADVVRLAGTPLIGGDAGLVRDFALSGDTLYLLDRTGRVLRLERRDTVFVMVHAFGRHGAGPGEFLTPTGISLDGSELAVIDNARLQFFTRAGELLRFQRLGLPCPMLLAGLAHSRSGLFVHGSCQSGSFLTDTVKSVLAWAADTAAWQIIAEDMRFTRDGRAGNIFTASSSLTPTADGVHLFGSGAVNCVWLIDDRVIPPTAEQRCPAAGKLYSADPPPDLRARLRAGAVGGVRLEWPATLPVFLERAGSAERPVLVRPFSTDSVVVQQAAPSRRDIAVAPLDGLVACKFNQCVWVVEASSGTQIIVLDLSRTAAAAGN